MNVYSKILLSSVLIAVAFTDILEARQLTIPEPEISQIFRNIAEINDPNSIRIMIDDYLLSDDPDEVDRIEIIDVSNIGFGSNDVLVVYPSRNVYLVDATPELADVMRGWNLSDQRRDGENTLTADYFYPTHADTLERWEINESEIDLVQNSLISDILLSLNRNYNDMPISIRFERGEIDEGFTFQMWNYNEEAFEFTPRPVMPEDAIGLDMMFVLYQDSTIIADTTYYDLIYINRTVEETIYLPEESRAVTNRFETKRLPDKRATQSNTGDRARIE